MTAAEEPQQPDQDKGARQRSTAPGVSRDAPESTGGADAVPLTPADDGRAGRKDPNDAVDPPHSDDRQDRPDEDAPGNFVDDPTATEVPEPNEPA